MSDETARQAESDLQRKCSSLVDREVVYCVSNLVYQLAQAYGENVPGLNDLCEEAFGVSTPIEDYEEAALQAGWTGPHSHPSGGTYFQDKTDGQTWACGTWRELCEAFDIEPYEREIFEHWIVSKWLAEKLQERGERIGEVGGMTVWGRPTTGQAISMDEVIRDITRDLHKEVVA